MMLAMMASVWLLGAASASAQEVAVEVDGASASASVSLGTERVTLQARVEGDVVSLQDGRVYGLFYVPLTAPGAQLEIAAPAGAHVAFAYQDAAVFSDDIPTVFTTAQPDQYVRMTVTEADAVWSVKLLARAGQRTVLSAGIVAPPPAAELTCAQAVLAAGFSQSNTMHCRGPETDACAVLVIEAGHPPTSVIHCKANTDLGCAKALLARGESPVGLRACMR